MNWLGEKPFHTLLLWTEAPARWADWQVVGTGAILWTSAAVAWAAAVNNVRLAGLVAGILLAFALSDWLLLAALPRFDVSFGPVQPPWLALTLLRWLLAVSAAGLAVGWVLPVLLTLAGLQAMISVLAAYGLLVEPFRLAISELEIPCAKLANPKPPVRILQLSDLHIERLSRRERALLDPVQDLSPDMVVLTGDFLNTTYNRDDRALTDLRTFLQHVRAPSGVYGVWGTAEVDVPDFLRPVLQELGITILEDSASEVMIQGQRLWLMGINCTRDLDTDGAMLRHLLNTQPPDSYSILLYHTPDLMPQAANLGVDLYLAGHTHGGQWRLPLFGALLTSSRFWKRYEAGHYRTGQTHLYVSRGLGMEGFGAPRARFLCPPELVVVTLRGLANSERDE
jgi:predicted MPP superfamily phosphohydrolase